MLCLYMWATCFGLSLCHHQACHYKNIIKEDIINLTVRRPFVSSRCFLVILKYNVFLCCVWLLSCWLCNNLSSWCRDVVFSVTYKLHQIQNDVGVQRLNVCSTLIRFCSLIGVLMGSWQHEKKVSLYNFGFVCVCVCVCVFDVMTWQYVEREGWGIYVGLLWNPHRSRQ